MRTQLGKFSLGEGLCVGYDTGDAVSQERYAEYLATVLPTPEDRRLLADIFKESDWIAPKKSDTMDA